MVITVKICLLTWSILIKIKLYNFSSREKIWDYKLLFLQNATTSKWGESKKYISNALQLFITLYFHYIVPIFSGSQTKGWLMLYHPQDIYSFKLISLIDWNITTKIKRN